MTPFSWAVDRDGYSLTPDRSRIRRRGGVMAPYSPADQQPPLHHEFVNAQIFGAEGPERALEFVRRFGFLGAADRGADATEEPVEWIQTQHTRLSAFQFFFADPDAKEGLGSFAQFNNDAPGHFAVTIEPDNAGVPQLGVAPRTLISWLWLAAGRELTGEGRWVRCALPSCGRLFEIGPGHGTRRRKYCSDAHRAADNYRKRQEGTE